MALNIPIEVQRQPRHREPRFVFHNYADPVQAEAVEAAQARVVAARNRSSRGRHCCRSRKRNKRRCSAEHGRVRLLTGADE